MKKFIAIFNIIIIVLFCISLFNMQAVAEKNSDWNWEKLTDCIYLDKNSITQTKYIMSAWFKVYNSERHRLYSIDDIPVYYDSVQFDIDCTGKSISIEHSKSYDVKNEIIEEYTNPKEYNKTSKRQNARHRRKVHFGKDNDL